MSHTSEGKSFRCRDASWWFLARACGLLKRWVTIRAALAGPRGQANRYERLYGPFRAKPAIAGSDSEIVRPNKPTGGGSSCTYLPSDPLCWVLTLEIVLKILTPIEYKALAAWFRNQAEYNLTTSAISAARKIATEADRRSFF